MQMTLKMVEKLDDLLEEAEEYIQCATMHSDNNELKSAYLDLARCHFDGYEKLSKIAERTVERKSAGMPDGQAIKQMMEWHKDKFDERASKIKHKMDQVR